LEVGAKRRTGGWAKALPDIEWFVRRESEVARAKGKKLFLHGFSMVRARYPIGLENRLTSREEERYLLSRLDLVHRLQRRLLGCYLV
jgi:hypothetical protein